MAKVSQIRNLTASDIPDALQLSDSAGWNQTDGDWRLLLDLAPETCFCIQADGRVAATATLLGYGDRLAWIGMVLTHPDYQRKGFASRLVTFLLERADELNIRTLKLDATELGQSLYARYGFTVEQPVERWVLEGTGEPTDGSYAPDEIASRTQLDAEAFGVSRAKLLEGLRRHGNYSSNRDAYLFTRPGRMTTHIGPCLSRERKLAYELLKYAIGNSNAKAWSWDLLPRNQEAVALATELGFAPARRLVRMSRGQELRGKEEYVYATAGFEFG